MWQIDITMSKEVWEKKKVLSRNFKDILAETHNFILKGN